MADGRDPLEEVQTTSDLNVHGSPVNFEGPVRVESLNLVNCNIGSLRCESEQGLVDENNGGIVEGDFGRDILRECPPTDSESKVSQNKEDETRLSQKIVMYDKQLLCKGARVNCGRQDNFPDHHRDIAVKLIEYQEKNMREIKILTKLSHHYNIVNIIEAGEHRTAGHSIYIAMELCSKNLQTYINENRQNPLNVPKSFSYSKQLVEGLLFLHENKIIHRDLKPDNVLISRCSEFIKLSDFGLSREVADGQTHVTVTHITAGSDGYRPPELYKTDPSQAHVRPSADIFPLGLVIHLIFSNGKHPFGDDPHDWSYNIRKNKKLDISRIPQFDPPIHHKREQLLDLLGKMLEHKPSNRPTSQEVLDDHFFSETQTENDVSVFSRSLEVTDISYLSISEDLGSHSLLFNDSSEQDEEGQSVTLFADSSINFPQLRSLLTEVEHEINDGGGKEKDSMKRVENFVSQQNISAMKVREMAYDLLIKQKYIQALTLFRASYRIHEIQCVPPDDKVRWIRNCVFDLKCATESLITIGGRSCDFGLEYGLEFMEQLHVKMRDVKHATTDYKVQNEADCLLKISYICNLAGEYDASARYARDGVDILERQYGVNASKLNLYGRLLNNIGMAHGCLGRNAAAQKFYSSAIKAYREASDFASEKSKREKIRITEDNYEGISEILRERF